MCARSSIRNGDGMGDFRGLTQKLDYLQDLGVTALWLLPFSPSPWRDDGYDISDYTDVHPSYGTLRDFQNFLREAHSRGLRVITEVVVNHTSDQHPWFQRARRSPPGSKFRDFYVWSDTPDKYRDARIIFKDFETLQLVLGSGRQSLLLASLLFPSAGSEFRQPRGPRSSERDRRFLAGHGRRWISSGRHSVSLRARRNELRKPAGDA